MIIPSYRFECCGSVTEWGIRVRLKRKSLFNNSLEFQVWRPSPSVNTTGCYTLVGSNSFINIHPTDRTTTVTPLPHDQIQVQPGDVVGFYITSNSSSNTTLGDVAITRTQTLNSDGNSHPEEVWLAKRATLVPHHSMCPYPVGVSGGLDTFTTGAPVVTALLSKLQDRRATET